MDERAWWDNSVWDHTDPISQRWPNPNQASTGWKFAAIVHHFSSDRRLLRWSTSAICISFFVSASITVEGQGAANLLHKVASKSLLPDESGMVVGSSWLLSAINPGVKGNRPILCIMFAANTFLNNWLIKISVVFYLWGSHLVWQIKVGSSWIECRPASCSLEV